MGKILVKSPATAHPVMAAAGSQTLQDLFRVTSKPGQIVGGALGGLSALTSLADASEAQQDAFSAAQMAAGRGVGTYLGAGKTVDTVAPSMSQGIGSAHAQLNRLRGVAPPQHRAQQIAVRAQRAQQPTASPDFNVPENFQLGMLGTSMGGGNYVAPGTKGIQRNLFNPAAPTPSPLEEAGLGNIDPTMMSGDTRAYGSSGVPSMSMTEMGQMLPGVQQPPPPQSQNARVGSTEVGVPAQPEKDLNQVDPEELVAQMSPQGAVGYVDYTRNMKNAGEPMELAFRLLKSVMR